MNRETAIQNAILIELSKAGALAWRQQVGKFRAIDDPARIVSVGVPGMSDIMACVPVEITPDMIGQTVGVMMAIEVKTPTGKQREDQKRWQAALMKRNGVYTIMRNPDSVSATLANIRRIMRGEFSLE